jgi:hypothetical protein
VGRKFDFSGFWNTLLPIGTMVCLLSFFFQQGVSSMKKLFVLVSFFAVVLILSKVSFAQPVDPQLIGEGSPAAAQVLPFGYPPHPTDGAYPAYGVPYSYPRGIRRSGRLTPPSMQPHPLPAPGVAAPAPPAPPKLFNGRFIQNAQFNRQVFTPPMTMGQIPQLQETLGVIPPAPATLPEGATVFHRPTPVRNFITLISAPRPYIGYDPNAGYPPFPGYQPPKPLLPQ